MEPLILAKNGNNFHACLHIMVAFVSRWKGLWVLFWNILFVAEGQEPSKVTPAVKFSSAYA